MYTSYILVMIILATNMALVTSMMAPPICPTNGFTANCACKFAGGCYMNGVPTQAAQQNLRNLDGIAPQGMGNYALRLNGAKNVNTICEGGTVAILYDCNARIPLFAATMITGPNAQGSFTRMGDWEQTRDQQLLMHPNSIAGNRDFIGSKKHFYCYKDITTGKLLNWDGRRKCYKWKFTVHRGHMIAASYGRGDSERVKATFTYTNVVPQAGVFNSGAWRVGEENLIAWASKCHANSPIGQEARIYVVVGVIPTTFWGRLKFFGAAGFSNYQDLSQGYRILVPEIMWTAACCIHTGGQVWGTLAFWRRNLPNREKVKSYETTKSVTDMFDELALLIGRTFTRPNVFPSAQACQ